MLVVGACAVSFRCLHQSLYKAHVCVSVCVCVCNIQVPLQLAWAMSIHKSQVCVCVCVCIKILNMCEIIIPTEPNA